MAHANLMLHRGGRLVTRQDVNAVEVPSATSTWFPIGHGEVLDTVIQNLNQIGFEVKRQQLALSSQGDRFFGTLDLTAPIAEGVSLAVGVRNSIDKSFPMGLCAGERVFVCDNLAFGSTIAIKHKHTRFGAQRFSYRVSQSVSGLEQYREIAAQRIERFQTTELTEDKANSLILQAFEQRVVNSRLLPAVIHEYREPQHAQFQARTVWSLLNCFTEVLKDRQEGNPHEFARQTIRLQTLLAAQLN